MGIMITHHGYNNPVYSVHKTAGVHYTQQNTVSLPSLIISTASTSVGPVVPIIRPPGPPQRPQKAVMPYIFTDKEMS